MRLDSPIKKTVWVLVATLLIMFAFGYALIPIYNIVCSALGINGKVQLEQELVQEAEYEPFPVNIQMIVHAADPGWDLVALEPTKIVQTQEKYTVRYQITNLLSIPRKGRAVPSISPVSEASHLKKLECFCMNQLEFEANESKEYTVTFFLDSKLPSSVEEMVLSYSMFDIKENLVK